jgi:hypothetical protein
MNVAASCSAPLGAPSRARHKPCEMLERGSGAADGAGCGGNGGGGGHRGTWARTARVRRSRGGGDRRSAGAGAPLAGQGERLDSTTRESVPS